MEAVCVVLALGTVETCRLMLASRSVQRGGVGNRFGQVGLHLHDHLTFPAAEFSGEARKWVLDQLRPWICRSRSGRFDLFSLKLEAPSELRKTWGLLPSMAHLTIEEPEGPGISALRSLLRGRQAGSAGRQWAGAVRDLPRTAVEAARVLYEAIFRQRRYVSKRAEVRLQINGAQEPESLSRVSLSGERDARGMPRAVVDWHVSQGELGSLTQFGLYLRSSFTRMGRVEGVTWHPALIGTGEASLELLRRSLDDARHLMGGARMGTDPRTSVVDPDLRVHGVENLWVASLAVFPDGSAQLPTETLTRLCERLAARLQRELLGR